MTSSGRYVWTNEHWVCTLAYTDDKYTARLEVLRAILKQQTKVSFNCLNITAYLIMLLDWWGFYSKSFPIAKYNAIKLMIAANINQKAGILLILVQDMWQS